MNQHKLDKVEMASLNDSLVHRPESAPLSPVLHHIHFQSYINDLTVVKVFKVNNKGTRIPSIEVVLVYLRLTLNKFSTAY